MLLQVSAHVFKLLKVTLQPYDYSTHKQRLRGSIAETLEEPVGLLSLLVRFQSKCNIKEFCSSKRKLTAFILWRIFLERFIILDIKAMVELN